MVGSTNCTQNVYIFVIRIRLHVNMLTQYSIPLKRKGKALSIKTTDLRLF
jgi:hypothetical protein